MTYASGGKDLRNWLFRWAQIRGPLGRAWWMRVPIQLLG